jgi:hypothetical protein
MHPVIDQKNELLPYAALVRPMDVLILIFDKVYLKDINSAMSYLLTAAIPKCDSKKEQTQFRKFNRWQQMLFRTLHVIYCDKKTQLLSGSKTLKASPISFIKSETNKKIVISSMHHPTELLKKLLKACPANYARIRLWDWMDRGLSNQAIYKSQADRDAILYYYQLCAALIAAAHGLDNPFIDY